MSYRFIFFRLLCGSPLLFVLCSAGSAQDYGPPANYYDGIEGLSGMALHEELNAIISPHATQSYDRAGAAMKYLDADPDNPDNIILIYSSVSVAFNTSGWNREHTWPQSFGADTGPGYSDFHHLFPADSNTNSDRSNFAFDYVSGSGSRPAVDAPASSVDPGARLFEPQDADKGRIARAMLYMAVRYDGEDNNTTPDMNLAENVSQFTSTMGRLSTLLEWNRLFPPDERELRRNDMIFDGFLIDGRPTFQGNRNPFVDYPMLGDAIYVDSLGLTWNNWLVGSFPRNDWLLVTQNGDPEGDNLANVLEFSFGTDPLAETTENLPFVSQTSSGRIAFFNYRRISNEALSGLTYAVEYSEFPLDPESWTVLEENGLNTLIRVDGEREAVRLSDQGLPPAERDRHFRLRVISLPGSDADVLTTYFDPVSFAYPDSESIFRYAPMADGNLRESDWLGVLDDRWYPLIDHSLYGYLHVFADNEQDVWLHKANLGWLYSGYGLFPVVYQAQEGRWIQVIPETAEGDLWAYDFQSETFIQL